MTLLGTYCISYSVYLAWNSDNTLQLQKLILIIIFPPFTDLVLKAVPVHNYSDTLMVSW
jgi:hypothetical protein